MPPWRGRQVRIWRPQGLSPGNKSACAFFTPPCEVEMGSPCWAWFVFCVFHLHCRLRHAAEQNLMAFRTLSIVNVTTVWKLTGKLGVREAFSAARDVPRVHPSHIRKIPTGPRTLRATDFPLHTLRGARSRKSLGRRAASGRWWPGRRRWETTTTTRRSGGTSPEWSRPPLNLGGARTEIKIDQNFN